jgi:putative ABC transport system permease protein
VETLIQDVRFGLRTLIKAPSFSITIVAAIALGIGATTTIFTVVDRIVLRPLPFPGSERTVVMCETSPKVADYCVASPPNVADWAASVPALESAGVARTESFVAETGGHSFGVHGGIATGGFFAALGTRPALGRLLEDRDLDRAANQVALLSHAFWRQRLGADPGVIGHSVTFDGRPVQIVGVLPADAYIPNFESVDVWKPLTAGIDNPNNRNWRGFTAIGRMKAGVTARELDAQLAVVRASLAMTYPDANAGWGLRTEGVREHIAGNVSATLWLFLGAVALVLLIACANVGSLLLVRASMRAPEFAMRASLGAGRWRLVRQVLTESLMIAAAGGGIGLVAAMFTTRMFVRLAPGNIPRLDEIAVDGRVALFTLALATAAAILFGLGPARLAARANLSETLKATRQTDRGGARLRSALVVVELALALVLLVGAGLVTRAFGRLLSWDPGFDRSGLTVSWMLAPAGTYKSGQAAVAVLERAREEVAAVPGVMAVGLGSAGPLFGGSIETGTLAIAGTPRQDADRAPVVQWYDADAHYFTALGRRIVRGRDFTTDDVDGAPAVAVVNEAFVARFFAADTALGRRVTVQDHAADIVGVVSDVRPSRPDRATPPEIFWPIRQYPRWAAYLVMRIAPEVAGVEPAARARVETVDPNVQITPFVAIDRMFSNTLVSPRFNVVLIGAFALSAILLAAVGVYGVIAQTVASRTREIGLRIALGATPRRLVADVVGRGVRLALAGMVVGLAVSLAVGRLLASLLYGVPYTDAITLVTTVTVFLTVAIVAGYVPARRASRVDPLTALRAE